MRDLPAVVLFLAAALLAVLLVRAPLMQNPGPAAVSSVTATSSTESEVPPRAPAVAGRHYIEIINSCGPHYEGACVVARAAPMLSAPVQLQLRTGLVLEVATTTVRADGHTWYKVVFDEWLRYPDRITGDLYVAGDYARTFTDPGPQSVTPDTATTTKRIVIDRSEQMLYAYDGDALFLSTPVSTGLELTPTPRGTFTVFRKTPTRYMQGPIPGLPSDQSYDLPGVPWDLYFTDGGGAIHGAYWHNEFGKQWSHGCVNLPLEISHILYEWTPVGTPVIVQD